VDAPAPSILHVDLAADSAAIRRAPWGCADPVVDAVGRYGGSALALAIVHAECHAGREEMPLVLAVGESVARGLPTAARACVASRVPLSGQYADGHVGGLLGVHLAAIASALVVRGRARGDGAVLAVHSNGQVALERVAGLEALDVPARLALLRARFPGAALLATGPAGDAGVPFASLANEAEPPSYVGRGGLGAVLGRLGLRGLAILPPARGAAAVEGAPQRARAPDPRAVRLTESVRLLARSAGGTFESRGGEVPTDPGGRKGCRGCPTPCGWVFERPGGALGARQGALEALRSGLGLAGIEDSLALLERCDALGLDAKEAGAALALLVEHADRLGAEAPRATSLRGDVGQILAVLDEIPSRSGLGARIADGAARLARELGVDAPLVRGQAARPESDAASLLGQCISTRGADPMRTFAFLAADVPDRARLARLIAPWPLPLHAEDPASTAGKGRLVAWTEAFLAAVDSAGFCAFSAAALLADGVLDLDELARWIAPDAVRATLGEDGRALLAAGASIALVQRDLARSFGARADDDRPRFAARILDEPGMLSEYARFRGLDAEGAPTSAAWRAAGTLAVLDLGGSARDGAVGDRRGEMVRDVVRGSPTVAIRAATGRVWLRSQGPLAAALGASLEIGVRMPATVLDVLVAAADARPEARAWLLRDRTAVPVVSRAGKRLGPGDPIEDGDALDLAVALSGG